MTLFIRFISAWGMILTDGSGGARRCNKARAGRPHCSEPGQGLRALRGPGRQRGQAQRRSRQWRRRCACRRGRRQEAGGCGAERPRPAAWRGGQRRQRRRQPGRARARCLHGLPTVMRACRQDPVTRRQHGGAPPSSSAALTTSGSTRPALLGAHLPGKTAMRGGPPGRLSWGVVIFTRRQW